MSAHKHEYLTPERARAILDTTPRTAEMSGLIIMAQRAAEPDICSTEAERQAAHEYNVRRARERGE